MIYSLKCSIVVMIVFSMTDDGSHFNDIGWWKEEHFYSADEDGDRRLNQTEFNK